MGHSKARTARILRMIALGLVGVCLVAMIVASAPARAVDVLIADRTTNAVYRYNSAGAFLNVVVTEQGVPAESKLLNQPTGLTLSPDARHLYVSSSQSNTVVRYDYNAVTGAAANPTVFADAADDIAFPNALAFSPDEETLYVSNLGGTGVARLHADGSSAGAPLNPFAEGLEPQFSGLAWTPNDELLVGSFADPAASTGSILRSNNPVTTLSSFIAPSNSLAGASGLLVHDNFVYATGMFASRLQRFQLGSGAVDPGFNVTGLAFPQGLMLSPDRNGFLVGILGFAAGSGHIAHYNFSGQLIGDGVFAAPGGGGFAEATAMATVPVPGDFNRDLLVNDADLDIWKANVGATGSLAKVSQGDADGNGAIDGTDFLVWQRNVTAASSPGAQAVPEPATLSLIAVAALLLQRTRSHLGETSA